MALPFTNPHMSIPLNCITLIAALIVKQKWADLILSENPRIVKTSEIRPMDCETYKNQFVGIAVSGTNAIHGEVKVYKTKKLTVKKFTSPKWMARHRITGEDLTYFTVKYADHIWAWYLDGALRYEQPIKFQLQHGQQVWIRLGENAMYQSEIANRLSFDRNFQSGRPQIKKTAMMVATDMFAANSSVQEVRTALKARWSGAMATRILQRIKRASVDCDDQPQPPPNKRIGLKLPQPTPKKCKKLAAATRSESPGDSVPDRRADPVLGGAVVSFDEMCNRYEQIGEGLTMKQLVEHWDNLKSKDVRGPPGVQHDDAAPRPAAPADLAMNPVGSATATTDAADARGNAQSGHTCDNCNRILTDHEYIENETVCPGCGHMVVD